jgi:hypothetical protein
MVVSVEQKDNSPELVKPIEAIPEAPNIPEHLEKGGVTTTQSQFTAQVSDDKGAPLIQTPASSVTITLPGDPEYLDTLSKGPITSAVTWFGAFWVRMMKKAWTAGVKVVVKPKN